MDLQSIKITRVIRRMRGRSQSFLVQAEDDHFYVAKFCGNPQGNRTLINEWLGHRILTYLGILVPPQRTLRIDKLATGREQLCFTVGNRTVPICGDIHFGSRVPVDPTMTAIFDFLPRTLLGRISNSGDFAKTFVVDKWLGQTDVRQAIFVRDEGRPRELAFKGYFIDNGMLFAGTQWRFFDSTSCGLYIDSAVYASSEMEFICKQTIRNLSKITVVDLNAAFEEVPQCWLGPDDTKNFDCLLSALTKRHDLLPDMISRHLECLVPR